MATKTLSIDIEEYKSIDELNELDQQLVEEAKKITSGAYSKYSGFSVGAAVLLENGVIITGNNQENVAYPSGLCAERVALFYANAQYPDVAVKAIAITASTVNSRFIETEISPCGSCRQVLLETETRFKKPIKIILFGTEKIRIIKKAIDLLPIAFA